MKRVFLSLTSLLLITILLCDPATLLASKKQEDFSRYKNSAPGFIENKGQIIDQNYHPNPAVLYLLNVPGTNVQLRSLGWSYDVYQVELSDIMPFAVRHSPFAINKANSEQRKANSYRFHRIDINLFNANPDPEIETSAPSAGYFNYYTAATPADGVMNVRSFAIVTYKNIYPGIDLQFTNNENQFEYNFILQPGADINDIKLKINGPQKIKRFSEGIRCETSFGDVDETIPVCYYTLNDTRVPVKGRFKKIAEHLYGFSVDKVIPSDAVLIIDPIPTRRWGTFYGGSGWETSSHNSCSLGPDGNVVISGTTESTNNIATVGAYQTMLTGAEDAFLVKFSPDGIRLWGTYYGGNISTEGFTNTIDKFGNIFLAGLTFCHTNIATPDAYQTILIDTLDAFLVKFNSAGQRIWGTYYGGNEIGGGDRFWALACDTTGNIYCVGQTTSPDFIATPGSVQPVLGGYKDAFLVKFTNNGQRLWATYYGGSALEDNIYCTVSKNGFVYLSGITESINNIATAGSFMPAYNGSPKGFLACFDLDGQRQWGTYFGGEGHVDQCGCVADTGSNVYLFGHSLSETGIATPGTFQTTFIDTNYMNGYLEKFTPTGQRLWGTYLGVSYVFGGAVDDSGFVFVSGSSLAGLPPQDMILASPNAYQTFVRGAVEDAFLGKFTGSGQRVWATYYGGTGMIDFEWGLSCVADGSDNIYMAGSTDSPNNTDNSGFCTRSALANYFGSPGSHQQEDAGGIGELFLVKFADCYSPDTASQIYGPLTLCQNSTGHVYSIDPLYLTTDYHWCVTGDLTITSGQGTVSITVDAGNTVGLDTISVYGINTCDTGFPKLLLVNIVPRPVPIITGNTSPLSGTSQTYSTETGKTNYQWTYSTGGTLISGGGTNDATITIQWNTGGAQWVRVNYTDANGCVASVPTQLDITVTVSVTVDFSSPDTVCVGEMITVNNLTQGGTTFYWNFCSGNANINPTGVNIGNPGGLLSIPTYLTLVKQGTDCFSFISCQGVGVIRYYHGSSFANNPVSWTNLGQFGLLTINQEGIQVKYDNGNWYGFVCNDVTIIRLDFGNSLWNTPTATDIGPFPSFNFAHGLVITREGTTWIGLVTCSIGQKLLRLNFGTSLTNIPVTTDFGNLGGVLMGGAAICLIQENNLWYALIMAGANTLARVTFGNSLLNTPTGVNLGNPGGFNAAGGLTLLRDCESTTGYWLNYLVNGQLGKLTFPAGITGNVTGTILGNIGGLARPHSFSEIFRQNDSLFAYVTNRDNGTLTRLLFPPCTNASVPSSNLFNPPPFSYNQPGTYNIHLIVDEGLISMASMCKPVVVMDPTVVNLGSDVSVCPGNTVTLDAGAGFNSYLWSTGATTQTLVVSAAGTYWVEVSKYGCTARDTVAVSIYTLNPVNLGPDTTVCQGVTRTFDAGPCPGCTFQWDNLTTSQMNIGSGQTYTTGQAGQYRVTTTDNHGCQNRDTVQLFVSAVDTVKVSVTVSANPVCAGTSVTFTATPTHGGFTPQYQWKVNGANAGSNSPVFTYIPANGDQVVCILTSSELCTSSNPATSNTITMVVNTNLPAGVTIAPSSNPFCPGTSVTFTATPLNGGIPVYQWKVNGINVGTNSTTYSYNPVNNDSVRCIMTSTLGCVTNNPASSATIYMIGNLAPVVSFTACFDTITRVNAKPIKLKGGIPLGGTYSGPGVNSVTGIFNPAAAGAGTHTITYSYTNSLLCSGTKSISILNLPSSILTCGNPLTDVRDNRVYQTVQIGSQCWMATNLNFGTTIASTQDQRDNCIAEKYCYNDNPTNCLSQGGLYQWDELMLFDETPAGQGFCPPTWHIPTESEWNTLFSNWTNSGFAGSPLKYSGYSGFNALLAGARHINKGWDYFGFATFYWSSTSIETSKAWAHGMNDPDPSVSVYPGSRVNAFSVRCLKD